MFPLVLTKTEAWFWPKKLAVNPRGIAAAVEPSSVRLREKAVKPGRLRMAARGVLASRFSSRQAAARRCRYGRCPRACRGRQEGRVRINPCAAERRDIGGVPERKVEISRPGSGGADRCRAGAVCTRVPLEPGPSSRITPGGFRFVMPVLPVGTASGDPAGNGLRFRSTAATVVVIPDGRHEADRSRSEEIAVCHILPEWSYLHFARFCPS